MGRGILAGAAAALGLAGARLAGAGSLAPGATYRVQFVGDTCQPPDIVGSFST